jgi:orotate phosphoribosyltransferase
VEETYELEYGSATVELHTDAVKSGDRVLLIDDLIATGGTMMAGKKLLEKLGATVVEGAAIVDLPELGGSKHLKDSGRPCSLWLTLPGTEQPSSSPESAQLSVLGRAQRAQPGHGKFAAFLMARARAQQWRLA